MYDLQQYSVIKLAYIFSRYFHIKHLSTIETSDTICQTTPTEFREYMGIGPMALGVITQDVAVTLKTVKRRRRGKKK